MTITIEAAPALATDYGTADTREGVDLLQYVYIEEQDTEAFFAALDALEDKTEWVHEDHHAEQVNKAAREAAESVHDAIRDEIEAALERAEVYGITFTARDALALIRTFDVIDHLKDGQQ